MICRFCCLEYWSFPGLHLSAWNRKWCLHIMLLVEFQIESLLELMRWTLVLRVQLTCFWFSFCCFYCFRPYLLVLVPISCRLLLEFFQLLSQTTILFQGYNMPKTVRLRIHYITSPSKLNCFCENQFVNIINELTVPWHMFNGLLQQSPNTCWWILAELQEENKLQLLAFSLLTG